MAQKAKGQRSVKVAPKATTKKPVKMAAKSKLEKPSKVAKTAAPVDNSAINVDAAKLALAGEAKKRAKKTSKGRGRKLSMDAHAGEGSEALAQKWAALYRKSEQIEAKPYNMRSIYDEKTAIMHKVLGWGYILSNRNHRLEVLFEQGIKVLISNYKS